MSLVVHPRKTIVAKGILMTKSDPGSHSIDAAMTRRIAMVALFASMWISAGIPAPASEPEIVSVRKIWDGGEHNAFTDLIRFQDRWWCTFREAKDHGPSHGQVRVIVSTDG